jgi:AcrR family transcriptional regulator
VAKPTKLEHQRRDAMPALARAFAELGYRRATTAELARRTGLHEPILFRIWPNKKAMFLDAIAYVQRLAEQAYERATTDTPADRAAEVLLDYEADHLGEFGHYRILFAGLGEADDAEIRRALRGVYRRFAELARTHAATSRLRDQDALDPALVAWAMVGVGTIATIARELGLVDAGLRRRLVAEVGRALLGHSS